MRCPAGDTGAAAAAAAGDALDVAAAAAQLGISNVWVARIWRKWRLQPWRRETFKFSTDPELEAKVWDVVRVVPETARQCRGPVRG